MKRTWPGTQKHFNCGGRFPLLLAVKQKKQRRRKKRNEWNLTATMTCCCVYQNGDDKSTHLETLKDEAVIVRCAKRFPLRKETSA